jgi:hypothetical protein
MCETAKPNELVTSGLVIKYVSCFPAHWKSRVCYHWDLETYPDCGELVFAITPLPNEISTNIKEVREFLEKQFVVLSCSDTCLTLQKSQTFRVVLLTQTHEKLGSYYCVDDQKCNIKHFVNEFLFPFYFKRPRHFYRTKRKKP